MDRWSKFASTANFRKIVFFGKLHKDFTEILQSGRRLIGFMKIFYENFLRGNPLIYIFYFTIVDSDNCPI